MEAEMHRAFDEADANETIKVIILTGAGSAFCAGYNMEPTEKGQNNLDPAGRSVSEYLAFWSRHDGARLGKWDHMWRVGKPIIAAVNGWAMGAGFWYQLASDITVASERAVFAQPEVRHVSNSSFLFAALCGWKASNRWSLTGDHFDAKEAYRIGMINEVVPHERLRDQVFALAQRMALLPEPSLRLNKYIAMQGLMAAGIHSALQLEGTLSALAHASHDPHREKLLRIQKEQGLRAFLDARDGPFQPEPMGPRSARGRKVVPRKRRAA
jgi:enoyl-CoA hydratase/carnithine racemase